MLRHRSISAPSLPHQRAIIAAYVRTCFNCVQLLPHLVTQQQQGGHRLAARLGSRSFGRGTLG
jgi:hypothetical protein